MITAAIYRTQAGQVAKDGPVAFRDMVFSGNFINEAGVHSYCETLARDNGIIAPWIEIVTTNGTATQLNQFELNAVLAGLRLLQRTPFSDLPDMVQEIYGGELLPMTADQIDELCERLNTEE